MQKDNEREPIDANLVGPLHEATIHIGRYLERKPDTRGKVIAHEILGKIRDLITRHETHKKGRKQ